MPIIAYKKRVVNNFVCFKKYENKNYIKNVCLNKEKSKILYILQGKIRGEMSFFQEKTEKCKKLGLIAKVCCNNIVVKK